MPISEVVTLMLSAGAALPEIEAFIEDQPLCEDEKAALWLWAWAERHPPPADIRAPHGPAIAVRPRR